MFRTDLVYGPDTFFRHIIQEIFLRPDSFQEHLGEPKVNQSYSYSQPLVFPFWWMSFLYVKYSPVNALSLFHFFRQKINTQIALRRFRRFEPWKTIPYHIFWCSRLGTRFTLVISICTSRHSDYTVTSGWLSQIYKFV